ncbi:MAG: imidazole glycerol phosphate synthase, glutamine amidotransferase subunit [Alphaproteobacteria bacterium RIFOXYD12_FULL_60_8]|nr:MAG: imidazole glycerol phosphate synthase, glutamine amidotransferase subunit [Alphaproteobacteria bacterium RIFOXYD12_FULL_60_8]
MTSLSIVEYGVGNIGSVLHACRRAGIEPRVARDAGELEAQDSSHILLPGVGAVGEALHHLRERGFEATLYNKAFEEKIPILSICVGMQMLAETCEEFGTHKGLAWIPGARVSRLAEKGSGLRLPHVGWNTIQLEGNAPLLEGLGEEHFYFVHTYAMSCSDHYIMARTDYAGAFVSAVRRNNIYGVQFHPEKSSGAGVALLKNFMSC